MFFTNPSGHTGHYEMKCRHRSAKSNSTFDECPKREKHVKGLREANGTYLKMFSDIYF
jgi:hypothetical protein